MTKIIAARTESLLFDIRDALVDMTLEGEHSSPMVIKVMIGIEDPMDYIHDVAETVATRVKEETKP